MYYDYPQQELAYAGGPDGSFSQYFFGDEMFVAPVVNPSDQTTKMANKEVWIPPGTWFELDMGQLREGDPATGTVLTKNYDLVEIPTFIRAGAVLPSIPVPMGPGLGLAKNQYTSLVFTIYPGAAAGQYQLYEDDGITTAYTGTSNGSFAITTCSYQYLTQPGSQLQQLLVNVSTDGWYPELPTSRSVQIRVALALPPLSVSLSSSGLNIGWDQYESQPSYWSYLGPELTLNVQLPPLPVSSKPLSLLITFPQSNVTQWQSVMSGMPGAFLHGMIAKQNLDEIGLTPGTRSTAGGYLDLLASTADTLSYLAGTNATAFWQLVSKLRSAIFVPAVAEVQALAHYQQLGAGALLQMYFQRHQDSLLCADGQCTLDNEEYSQLRVEGFQAVPGRDASAVALHCYYNEALQDHWVTTDSATPSGYRRCRFAAGYVLSQPADPLTAALSLWYHPVRHDHLTTATATGVLFAKQWGYSLVNASIGYVYLQPQSTSDIFVPQSRLDYSLALLSSVWFQ